jgi:cytochrome P450
MEGEVALRTLLGRFPKIELAAAAPGLRWRSSPLVHSLRTLPIRYER